MIKKKDNLCESIYSSLKESSNDNELERLRGEAFAWQQSYYALDNKIKRFFHAFLDNITISSSAQEVIYDFIDEFDWRDEFDVSNINESATSNLSVKETVDKLNELKHNYHYHYRDDESNNDSLIDKQVIEILSSLPDGTVLCQNYKDTSSGYTSFGSYHNEFWRVLKYTKTGDTWDAPHGEKTMDGMRSAVLYNDGDMKLEDEAKKDNEELSKTNKSSHKDYVPVSANTNTDNQHWDGNRYAL